MTIGRFITFEGGEGAGKTTQIARLVRVLRARGVEVVQTREPGGSPSAEAVRDLLLHADHGWEPLSEALLHYAARCEHLTATIRPALARGAWVVCDRFSDSTRAYQGFGLGLDIGTLEALEHMVVGSTRPDLTLILDLPPEVGLGRATGRKAAADRYERMSETFHSRLREGFLAIAARAPERCAVIDAEPGEEQVAEAVFRAVRERLGGPAAA